MSVLHGLDSTLHPCKTNANKTVLFTVVKTVIWSHSFKLLPPCCGASPGAVYLPESQLFSFHLALCRAVTCYQPQILSQATSDTQLKGRLNPIWIGGDIGNNCLFIPTHWTQNQIIGRTAKEKELVLCWATEHTPQVCPLMDNTWAFRWKCVNEISVYIKKDI